MSSFICLTYLLSTYHVVRTGDRNAVVCQTDPRQIWACIRARDGMSVFWIWGTSTGRSPVTGIRWERTGGAPRLVEVNHVSVEEEKQTAQIWSIEMLWSIVSWTPVALGQEIQTCGSSWYRSRWRQQSGQEKRGGVGKAESNTGCVASE